MFKSSLNAELFSLCPFVSITCNISTFCLFVKETFSKVHFCKLRLYVMFMFTNYETLRNLTHLLAKKMELYRSYTITLINWYNLNFVQLQGCLRIAFLNITWSCLWRWSWKINVLHNPTSPFPRTAFVLPFPDSSSSLWLLFLLRCCHSSNSQNILRNCYIHLTWIAKFSKWWPLIDWYNFKFVVCRAVLLWQARHAIKKTDQLSNKKKSGLWSNRSSKHPS